MRLSTTSPFLFFKVSIKYQVPASPGLCFERKSLDGSKTLVNTGRRTDQVKQSHIGRVNNNGQVNIGQKRHGFNYGRG